MPIKWRVTTRIVYIVLNMIPKRMKTGAQWNPFDIKQRVSKSNLEANENDFFAKKKNQNDNYHDTNTNKCVEKRGI